MLAGLIFQPLQHNRKLLGGIIVLSVIKSVTECPYKSCSQACFVFRVCGYCVQLFMSALPCQPSPTETWHSVINYKQGSQIC